MLCQVYGVNRVVPYVLCSYALHMLILGGATMTGRGDPAIVSSEFIYESAPFPSCHASTVVETASGELVAAWFGGTHESHPDVAIYVSRREHGRWTPPAMAADGTADGRRYACYNPVLFQPSHGPLMLFYKLGTGPRTWWGRLCTSPDDGRTWSAPEDLPHGILGPIKNKPIEVAGAILCPSSSEDLGWRVHFESTRDLGKAWTRTEPVNDGREIGAIQPSLLPLGNHRIRAIGRTQQGRMFAVDSPDDGVTWGPMRLIDVSNPNSGTDAVRLRDGRFLLVYNDSRTHRTPLDVAVSKDGETWRPVLKLETEPGEYSYPAVIQSSDGLVHVTYTWQRRRIRHVVIDPSRLH
ncbi:MAG: exo-alpha-sialidase [Fimbriimonas sp.]|nr:exo-alpha-sialidase [Fimbriimonas sp.]